jgi:peptidyl-tRNA hydrolase, PTH1 family
MHVVVGLGNPGAEYARTRHNVGFMLLNRLKADLTALVERKRFRAIVTEGTLGGEKLVLVAPQTFMNLSGLSVREVQRWFHLEPESLLVVFDDMDLPFGQLRLRGDGSAGGHNGMKSVIAELGTDAIPRLRIGVGRPRSSTISHVLSRFSSEEEAELPALIDRAADAVKLWRSQGTLAAMNEINRKPV